MVLKETEGIEFQPLQIGLCAIHQSAGFRDLPQKERVGAVDNGQVQPPFRNGELKLVLEFGKTRETYVCIAQQYRYIDVAPGVCWAGHSRSEGKGKTDTEIIRHLPDFLCQSARKHATQYITGAGPRKSRGV